MFFLKRQSLELDTYTHSMNYGSMVIGSLRKYRLALKLKRKEIDHQFRDNLGR